MNRSEYADICTPQETEERIKVCNEKNCACPEPTFKETVQETLGISQEVNNTLHDIYVFLNGEDSQNEGVVKPPKSCFRDDLLESRDLIYSMKYLTERIAIIIGLGK